MRIDLELIGFADLDFHASPLSSPWKPTAINLYSFAEAILAPTPKLYDQQSSMVQHFLLRRQQLSFPRFGNPVGHIGSERSLHNPRFDTCKTFDRSVH
jgi:hypothetical protein